VAGRFYPADAVELRNLVNALLAMVPPLSEPPPKALIVPHAGYIYSGPIAASAYARLLPVCWTVQRVVLIGPSHHTAFRGLAASSAAGFATPLGMVPVDTSAVRKLQDALPQIVTFDEAHAQEHSLEVQLPFLQVVLGDFALVPLLAGDASPEELAAALEVLWGGPETCVIASSDLSHYLDYATANRLDRATANAIEELCPERIEGEQACGRIPIQGLLCTARAHGLRPATVDLRSSGDTAGPRDRVVGYGAFVFG
jgi:AmmeMemoRadiSam system protein B